MIGYMMNHQISALTSQQQKDLARNRDGRLSSRQWWVLISEPLTTLLLLLVPMILLIGRFGVAGRWIVIGVVLVFIATVILRAIRFSRVRLHYQVLHVEQLRPRWMFWRKLKLMTKHGNPLYFDNQIASKPKLQLNQTLKVYYIIVADRHILINYLPEKHPQSSFADPTTQFTAKGGLIHDN